MNYSAIVICLLISIYGASANGQSSWDEIVEQHILRLQENEGGVAAIRLLNDLCDSPETNLDKFKQARLEIASTLIIIDGNESAKLPKTSELDDVVSAMHIISLDRKQTDTEVFKKLAKAKRTILETVKDSQSSEFKLVVYPSNHAILVTTTLRDQLNLICVLNNPVPIRRK